MKKAIIPFDGGNFSKGAFDFALGIHQEEPILLTGIFLPKVDYARIFFFPTAFAAPAYVPMGEDFDEETMEKNIEVFKNSCQKNGIEYRVHKDLFDSAIQHLTKESRFADFMIVGSEVFYTTGSSGTIEYLKDALRNTECPVIVVPEKFVFPKTIILAYDGSESSVYAIKQFANLFPEFSNWPTILVYAGDEKKAIPDEDLIEEFGARHFSNLTVSKIDGNNRINFNEWLKDQDSPLLVSGSFSRSGISELFNSSFITSTIKDHEVPIFIAHH
ncbi:MAG: hypothetical protein KGM98_13525 [Bacteroidota bacterium]|nr:hypothetical protein [Bacteroidota bacterium]